ncbi:MAG: OsmC family protein [Bacteroidetes bacterium]|nr:OsmC family protein [Bacteroidota bacterium]MCB0844320.1 OsmC family protein [Bacteroidota bacterium]MCB0854584.1 OsmC family protein [Bacteroidota bacterium]
MKRKASALWQGTGLEGKGSLTSTSKVLDNTPYSFQTRFVNEDGKQGTNPEELIAAAHAGCFSMALSFALSNAGFTPESLDTQAIVEIEKGDNGFSITHITLRLNGKVSGISPEQFTYLAEGAKANCPVSKALSAVPISLDIHLG